MFQERCYERDFDVNNNFYADNMENNIDYNYNMNNNAMPANTMSGGCNNPIVEQMQERVVNRTIMHEVPHVCPIRTRIVNHHVYRHTYRPEYSCCEENVVSNVSEGSCCNFR